ncbi:MAG: hypothetical protein SFW36_00325 [Leptolyngbyaceae cyanobacterium bins.59]|nr:hypothetical protein [Leptolyngbyaceae cyanobacterium bins.59]
MANYSLPMTSQMSQDTEIWTNLKQAIATSSGFRRWQVEHISDEHRQELSLEYQVGRYLRETLETLAY